MNWGFIMRITSIAAAVVATACMVAAGSPALATEPHENGQGNQHSIDAHLRNELRKAAKATGAVIDTGTPGYGGLLGAPDNSYVLTSSTYSMGKFGDSAEVLATCGTGYYVWYTQTTSSTIGLDITVNSDSSFVGIAAGYPKAWNQVGSLGGVGLINPQLYQGFFMKLSNDNPFYSNTGSFSWTCVPLPA